MSENAKITVENMNLYYGKFHALKNINMEIPEKEITAFIGPSGCGKSTLLKSLNRMNDLVEGCVITGKVQLDGEDIYGDMDVNLLRKRVGMVFQKPNPFPMSIYDNIAYGPRTHGIRSKAKLDDIVEKSLRDAAIWEEVKDRLKKSALGMSGGQQQRLCIARALAVQPEVLLMDEPTSALDPISTSKIEELAMELKKDYTIVMVTHNMQQATRISDKTAFFLLGEVIEFADTDKLFSMPADKRTEDYMTGRFGCLCKSISGASWRNCMSSLLLWEATARRLFLFLQKRSRRCRMRKLPVGFLRRTETLMRRKERLRTSV